MPNTPKKLVRAALYQRTSGDDNDLASLKAKMENQPSTRNAHSLSIEEQVKQCEALCKQHGYTVVGTFQDPNLSGRTYPTGHEIPDRAFDKYFDAHINRPNKRTRPGLGALFDTKGIDFIIVRDIYRLIRPTFQSHLGNHVWQYLTDHKVKIHSCADGIIDSNKFEDLMLTNLKLQIADQSKRDEVESSTKSLRNKKNAGQLASGVKCIGYRSQKGEPQKVDAVPEELVTVRLIFTEYLAGRNMSEIARHLNDTKRLTTFTGKRWTLHLIRKVLRRPWYAGLMRNTSGDLIQSQIFTNELVIVKPEEFYLVRAKLQQSRKHEYRTERDIQRENRQLLENKPLRGGSRLGKVHDRGRIHPFTGLLKCPHCMKNLYAMPVTNFYQKGTLPVRYHHYLCRTPFFTKDPAFEKCNHVRIKEYYPKECLDIGVIPKGNGIIEGLFPLVFHGFIKHYIQKTSNQSNLIVVKAQLESDVERVKAHQLSLLRQQEEETIDAEQYALGMKQARERTAQYRKRLADVEQQLAGLISDDAVVPKDFFDNPSKINLEEMRELAHATFKEIWVDEDHIRLVLKASIENPGINPELIIPRMRHGNARDLPFWKARISSKEISPNTRIGIAYFNKSTESGVYLPVDVLYRDDHIEVLTIGSNTGIDKKQSEEPPIPLEGENLIKSIFGPPPTYQRILETDSYAFFTASPLNKVLKLPQKAVPEKVNFLPKSSASRGFPGSF